MLDREVDVPVWVVLGRSCGVCWRSRASLGAHVGGLGSSWDLCWRSWAALGAYVGGLGRSEAALGTYVGGLGRFWAALGASVGGLGPLWGSLGPLRAVLAALGSLLDGSGDAPGPQGAGA